MALRRELATTRLELEETREALTAEHPGYKYLVSGPDPLLMKVISKKVATWDYGQKM